MTKQTQNKKFSEIVNLKEEIQIELEKLKPETYLTRKEVADLK